MDPIILASASPRRREILKEMNIPFVVHPANIPEEYPQDMDLLKISEYLAIQKMNAVVRSVGTYQEIPWVLAADTTIIFEDKIIGKPKDREEAKEFLTMLQGKTHTVVTGLALFNGNLHDMSTRNSVNKVTFNSMTDDEIEWYLNTDEWHGVAGAYRIQGKGSCFIQKIEGTESSVMGLPMFELYDILHEQNYSFID